MRSGRFSIPAAAAAALAILAGAARGDDWPQWRGPGSLGVSPEENLPAKWSHADEGGERRSENILWIAELPDWGNSSPVVIGDRIYLTAQRPDESLVAIALDRRKGKILWERAVGKGMQKAHKLHNMATPTPAASADRVWFLFGTGDLACLDGEGSVLWKKDLQAEHGKYKILWGMGSSPVIHGGRLFIVCMHTGSSYVLALDAKSGDLLWKTPRDLPAADEAPDSYSSPIFHRPGGRDEMVIAGADHITAYDPASGGLLWKSAGLKIPHPYGRTMASPGAEDGIVVACSASVQGLGTMIAVRAGAGGDASAGGPLWRYDKFTPDCPSPLCYRGLVYVVRDDGVASCLERDTGKLLWRERLEGDFKASPVGGDGKVFFTGMDGTTTVIAAGPERKVLSVNRIEGAVIATPALSGGAVYIRARDRLYAIGGAADGARPGEPAERAGR